MKKYKLAVLLIISQLCSVLSLESTGPAFMWSPHIDMELEENVNYQTLSLKNLARAVLFKGRWSNIMCESKSSAQPDNVAVVFVGKEEFVASTMEKGIKGRTDLLVVCHRGFSSLKNLDHPHTEGIAGDVFSELISSLDNSGAEYAVLYVSDTYKYIQHPSSYQIGRFLAEAPGNVSLEAVFCNGVCQIKKTLLEALFVTIVLLTILISGFCCMMGIDSLTRFEAPQESS